MDPMDEDKPAESHSKPSPPPPPAPLRPSPATTPSAAPSAVATGKHPAPDPSPSSAASTTAGPAQVPSKRRRGLGIVTPNACTECRKKRAKVSTRRFEAPPCQRMGKREGCSSEEHAAMLTVPNAVRRRDALLSMRRPERRPLPLRATRPPVQRDASERDRLPTAAAAQQRSGPRRPRTT